MYAGVDIGGTKTLVASLDADGVITEQIKFPTPPSYPEFIDQLADTVAKLTTKEWKAAAVAMPGRVDHDTGIGEVFGNLPWENVPLLTDAKKIFKCPTGLENDANLAGLSESMLHKYAQTVLYVTVSTGIGTAVIRNQKIDDPNNHGEGGHMILPYKGQLLPWQSFASGRAIVKIYGKRAVDITDDATWHAIARNLSLGLLELCAMVQPDLIILGGSVGTYFERYGKFLEQEMKRYELPMVPIPPIVEAKRPEEAVVYGCYDYAKGLYG